MPEVRMPLYASISASVGGSHRPSTKSKHLTRDVEPELVGFPFLCVPRFHTTPPLFRRHIEDV
jgi:hypothetical protein